jgi:tetratricopeptide (TPR) repeat protein
MPKDWTVDKVLDELLFDGLIVGTRKQIQFLHQSVQEFFTAQHFALGTPGALVQFTPKIVWDWELAYEGLPEIPGHRFVQPLLMMVGLLQNATQIVEGLSHRHPVLAAAAIRSSTYVNASLKQQLEDRWRALLDDDDARQRSVAGACLALSGMSSEPVVSKLIAMVVAKDYFDAKTGSSALARFDLNAAVVDQFIASVIRLTDHQFNERSQRLCEHACHLLPEAMFRALFAEWRRAAPDSSAELRLGELLASFNEQFAIHLLEELQSVSGEAVDFDVNDVWRKLKSTYGHVDWEITVERSQQRYSARREKFSIAMKSMRDADLAQGLRSEDASEQAAAAQVIAERNADLGDAIVRALLEVPRALSRAALVAAIISLWGEDVAVSRLERAALLREWLVGTVSRNWIPRLKRGPLPSGLADAFELLGVVYVDSGVVHTADEAHQTWSLREGYELRAKQDYLELYDCNCYERAILAIGEINGPASTKRLRWEFSYGEPRLKEIAADALITRGDPEFPSEVLATLKTAITGDEAFLILRLLWRIYPPPPGAVKVLMNEMLRVRREGSGEIHPEWGHGRQTWGHFFHQIFPRWKCDAEAQTLLDDAMADGTEPQVKVIAIEEFVRWFGDNLPEERVSTWRTPERMSRFLTFALFDRCEAVRHASRGALSQFMSEIGRISETLAATLLGGSHEARVAAAEVIIHLRLNDLTVHAVTALRQIEAMQVDDDIRHRMSIALRTLSGEPLPLLDQIRAARDSADWPRLLDLTYTALQRVPFEAELYLFRGEAYAQLESPREAAICYRRAFDLKPSRDAGVPLAAMLIEVDEYASAYEVALKTFELVRYVTIGDNYCLPILAWAAYKAEKIEESLKAAKRLTDIDPVHPVAVWIMILIFLKQSDLQGLEVATRHARLVKEQLSPGFPPHFMREFREELQSAQSDNVQISAALVDLKQAFLHNAA